jgi:hypothetical protein
VVGFDEAEVRARMNRPPSALKAQQEEGATGGQVCMRDKRDDLLQPGTAAADTAAGLFRRR